MEGKEETYTKILNIHKNFEHTLEVGRSSIDRSDLFILANTCAVGFREVLSVGCEAWSVGRAAHGAPPLF